MFTMTLENFCKKHNIAMEDIIALHNSLEKYKEEKNKMKENIENAISIFKRDIQKGSETSPIIQDLLKYKNQHESLSKYFQEIENIDIDSNDSNIYLLGDIKSSLSINKVRTKSIPLIFMIISFIIFFLYMFIETILLKNLNFSTVIIAIFTAYLLLPMLLTMFFLMFILTGLIGELLGLINTGTIDEKISSYIPIHEKTLLRNIKKNQRNIEKEKNKQVLSSNIFFGDITTKKLSVE